MNQPLRVGIIGDYEPNSRSHIATEQALAHAAAALSLLLDSSWLPTQSLADGFIGTTLKQFDGLCAPGGLYKSMNEGLRAIQFAREKGWPFIGT